MIIAGASGTGKSALLREIVQRTIYPPLSRSLVYAPYPAPYGRTCFTLGEAARSLARRQSVTIIQDAALYVKLMPHILERGNIMLVIDEAHELYPRGKPIPIMQKILREGRNRGIGLIAASQRPTACHTDMLGVAQGVIIGRLIGPADIAYSRQWGVKQPLPMYSFHAVLPGEESIIKLKSKRYN